MSLRVKVLVVFTLALVAAIGVLDWGVERYARQQYQEVEQQRSGALIAQFQQELRQRGQEVAASVKDIADAESTTRMVLDLSRPESDASLYANDARGLAEDHQLDYLELANNDGTLISIAQWPEQVGYKNDWVTREANWNQQGAFLDRVELADGVELGLMAVRMVHVGDSNFYIIGGRRMDRNFLQALELPAGMRVLLYRSLEDGFVAASLTGVDGPVANAERFAPLVGSLKKPASGSGDGSTVSAAQASTEQTIQWTADPESTEKFVSVPLTGRHGEFQGALLLGSSQGSLASLINYVRELALVVAAGAMVTGFLMSWWISARVSRPLRRLADGIDEVSGGDWDARVDANSGGEFGELLRGFNTMTDQLTEQRSRLLAAERVASWREMAQQLASEVQAGIVPLQRALEKLEAAEKWGQEHEQAPEKFDEVFSESLATLHAEIRILQAAAEGLAEFAKRPEPHFETVRINEILRAAVKSFEPQFCLIGRPPITPELYLDEEVAPLWADATRMKKAIESLLYRALVDMPAGGTITIRTKQQGDMVHLVIADMGRGFDIVDRERLFSMQSPAAAGHGAVTGQAVGEGLILATVQAIISDYGGRITAESAPGAGTTFFIDLPGMAVERKMPPKRKPKAEKAPTKSGIVTVERPVLAPEEAVVEASSQMTMTELKSESMAEPLLESLSEIAPQLPSEPEPSPEAGGGIAEDLNPRAVSETVSDLKPNPAPEELVQEHSEHTPGERGQEIVEEPVDASVANAARTQPVTGIPIIEPTAIETPVEETESTSQLKEPVNVDGPFAVLAEITLDGQSEFWDDAPEDIPVFSFEGTVTSDGSVTAPAAGEQSTNVEGEREVAAQEKSGDNVGAEPAVNAPPAEPSLLHSLEEILEAAPEEKLQDVEKKVPEKALEKEIWRSPLTYR